MTSILSRLQCVKGTDATHISTVFLVLLGFLWIEHHGATSIISHLAWKSISYWKKFKKICYKSPFGRHFAFKHTMKCYEYMKYSYQKQLIWTYTLLLAFKKLEGASCIKPLGCLIAVTNTWKFWRYQIKSEFEWVFKGPLLGDGCYAKLIKSLHHCKKLSTEFIIVHFKASRRSINNFKWIDS